MRGFSVVVVLGMAAALVQAQPTITSLSPASAAAGSAGFDLIVEGAAFDDGSTVLWNGTALTTTRSGASTLSAAVPASAIAAPGSAAVSVRDGTGATSTEATFTILPPPDVTPAAAPPSITGLSPSSVEAGGSAFRLAVAGAGFDPRSTVLWGGTALPTDFVNGSLLAANVNASRTKDPGTVAVTVRNPDGQTSAPATFTIGAPPSPAPAPPVASPPQITGLTPPSARAGGPRFTLTVRGTNLDPGAAVLWNTAALSTAPVDAGRLDAEVPATAIARPGAAAVRVRNPDGATSDAASFAVAPAVDPVIAVLSPASVAAGSGAFTLTVNGTDFVAGATVNWNGSGLPTTFVSASQLTAVVDPARVASPGIVTVTVTNPDGGVSAAAGFVIGAPPAISSLTPNTTAAGGGGFNLAVAGSGFAPGAEVLWNGTAVTTIFINGSSLTAAVPAALIASAGTIAVTVRNPDGTASAAATFTVAAAPAPAIAALSPSSATAGAAAFTLTVDGSNFVSGAVVVWNTTALTTSFGNAGRLTAAVPAALIAAAGAVQVTVRNPDGAVSAPAAFTVGAAPPSISGLSPGSATAGAAALTLTVNGSGFVSGAVVLWNDTTLPTTFGSPTQLTAAVDAGRLATAGTANVTVRNPDGAASGPRPFTVGSAPTIATASPLPRGTMGTAYSQTLQATGGTPPYTWTVASGTLPDGIALSGAALSGTPRASGTFTFTLRVADAGGGGVSKEFSLTIESNLAVSTASVPNGSVGAPYSETLAATGGAGPYTWAVSGGALPAGLSLAANGTLSGTPSGAGTANFTVRVTDASNATATRSLSIAIAPALAITTASLPAATQNSAYSKALDASGGNPPYSWSIAGGALPAGIRLSGNTLSGTPTANGAFTITVRVADSEGAAATRELTLTVAPPVEIATESLAAGTAGASYSQQVTARGGTQPYTWSVQGGALPGGLTLSPAGAIGGKPSAAGDFSATLRVTDSAGASATRTYAIRIAPPLAIEAPASAAATSGTAFTVAVAATGGNQPYTWSVASGSLPAGIQLDATGLKGTPGAVGIFDLTLQVSDAVGAAATHALRLAVNPAPSITTTAPSRGIVGVRYSEQIEVSGGTPPFKYSIEEGGLPPGLGLTGSRIDGTPTQPGSFNFRVSATDANGATTGAALTLVVGAGLTITTASVPNATAGTPYSQTLAAAGGAGPYTWSISSGSLPAGLSLNAATGAIAGTPTTPATTAFTVQVSDTTGVEVSQQLRITVAPPLQIATASLPPGAASAPYSQALSAAGGTPPYTWALASGALPPGVELNASGALGGTPRQEGDFTFTVRATDAAGAAATKEFVLKIGGGLAITTAPALPAARVGAPYLQTLVAAGGVAPYTWALGGGSSLPAGLSLGPATGAISGTPTTPGTFNITVQVTDAASTVVSRTFSLTVASDLAIQTDSLPNGSSGSPYSVTLAAAGGKPPYTWSITNGGPLPAGLTLDPAGAIRGTPTATGPVTFTLVATDSAGAQASKQLTLTIAGGLTITTPDFPPAVLNAPYSQTLAAGGGTPPYRWSVSTGSLPAGVSVNAATGVIAGTPTAAGVSQFTLQVTDATQATASRAYTLTVSVSSGPAVTVSGIGDAGQPLDQSAVGVTLAAPFQGEITGQVTLAFAPEAVVPADDKAIAFSNGQRTIAFRIPAGQTQAVFDGGGAQAQFQNGTVAGTVTATVTMQVAGTPFPAPAPKQMRIAPGPPAIRTVRLVRTAGGFEVWTTGFATTRQVTDAVYVFERAAGGDLQTDRVAMQIGPAAQTWYQDPASSQWGSQFTLVQSFTVQGNIGSINAVSVTLNNAQGSSTAVRATF